MTDSDTHDQGTEVATQTKSAFAVVNTPASEIQAILQENTGGELTASDLDMIKVPTGGGLFFTVPGLEGDKPEAEIEGVIVHFTKPRSYWAESFGVGGGGTPPDCSSPDGVEGVGSPGGSCAECPLSKFGSAVDENGNEAAGQACAQKNNLFILRKQDILPIVIVGPPTSLKNIRQYLLRLASNQKRFYHVVTKFKLVKATSKTGVDYAQIEPSFVEFLEEEAATAMTEYHNNIGPVLDGVLIADEQGE